MNIDLLVVVFKLMFQRSMFFLAQFLPLQSSMWQPPLKLSQVHSSLVPIVAHLRVRVLLVRLIQAHTHWLQGAPLTLSLLTIANHFKYACRDIGLTLHQGENGSAYQVKNWCARHFYA